MRATWIAGGIVVAVNVLAIVPAARERATPVGRVTIAVCGEHVGEVAEVPMLDLPLATPPDGWGGVIDGATLGAIGFGPGDVAVLGDRTWEGGAWPSPRRAWLVLRQDGDSLHRFRVVRASVDRPTSGAGELVVRGLITIQFIWRVLPGQVDSIRVRRSPVVGVAVVRLLPPQLGLDRTQAGALMAARVDTGAKCTDPVPVTIASGPNGGIWVEGVGSVR